MLINKSVIFALLYLGYITLVVSGKRTTGSSGGTQPGRKGNGIDVPLGNVLIKNVHGAGTQEYKCTGGKLKFVDESANLFEPDNRQDKEGTYNFNGKTDGNGGNIEFVINGSKAIFKLTGRDISKLATNAPDLRYIATTAPKKGILEDCTFVQRRNTLGGVPPKTCKEGATVKISFQADYAFFGKGKRGGTTSGASPSNDFVPLPKNIQGTTVPADNKVLMKLRAVGVQIYRCRNGKYDFVNAQSDLFLNSDRSFKEGRHFFNTNPDENGGRAAFVVRDSTAVFKKIGEKKSKNPSRNIAELLLVRTSTSPGALGEVTFVQRVNTVGGVAPGKCTTGEFNVPYEADYIFYRKEGIRRQ